LKYSHECGKGEARRESRLTEGELLEAGSAWEERLRDCAGTVNVFLASGTERKIECVRVGRAGYCLSAAFLLDKSLLSKLIGYMLERRFDGGGWADPEETAWSLGLLSQMINGNRGGFEEDHAWLSEVRFPCGGWGHHSRDQARIPATALVIALVPEVATEVDWAWLRNEWGRDLERPVKLSYKGGFYLLAEKRDAETTLPDTTIRFLEQDQNDDGGFGPWKDHPIGSDPWSTGVVLWGLSRWIDRVDRSVVERALDWLEKTQLPSGYWPYHYLDEGTSYALIGAVSALKALQRL